MKKTFLLALMAIMSLTAFANKTFPLKGTFVSPADKHILYAGRISFTNPERPAWNYPGVQIVAAFEGTSLKMMAKPNSGYFVAQIDGAEPFKVAFRGAKDSVVTLATALPDARHTVRLMYAIEGYEMYPEFWGFILDSGRQLVDAPAFPSRKIEFIGNSITCGYGNEGTDRNEHFEYETENHYYSYASITARNLCAQHWVVARSGIGAYRNYGEAKTGSPRSCMPVQYEYTGYALDLDLRKEASFLKEGYQKLYKLARQHNPKAKIVFLTGSMLYNQELKEARQLLDEVTAEAQKAGDKEVYRFDMSPIQGNEWYGNDWHPNIWQDEKMAGELTAYLRGLMKWF